MSARVEDEGIVRLESEILESSAQQSVSRRYTRSDSSGQYGSLSAFQQVYESRTRSGSAHRL
eukprot:2682640-Rhodomonas_salina.1